MELIREIQTNKNHPYYDEYLHKEFVVKLAVGESISLAVNGTEVKTYTAKNVNCSISIILLDKGLKRDPTKLQELQQQLAHIEKLILEETE